MASVLQRLGRFAHRHRWPVVAVWLAVLALAGAGALTLGGSMSSSYTIPGTESQEALDLLAERMPAAGVQDASATVVFVAEDGAVTDDDHAAGMASALAAIAGLDHVTGVTDPVTTGAVSQDGSTAYASVGYDVTSDEVTDAERDALFAAGDLAEASGLRVEYGGTAVEETFAGGATEGVGVLVAAVVLAVTFGSVVAAGLPLVTALLGVGIGVLGVLVSTAVVDLSSTAITLAVMIGLAVGIDYALLIVSRHRQELARHGDLARAIGTATGTAGSAVVFAGATVVIALAALSVVGIPFLTAMGLAAAATVVVAVLIALTLLPALLSLAGTRVLGRRGATAAGHDEREPGTPAAERWARTVTGHPVVVSLLVVAGLGAAALPAADLELGMPNAATMGTDTTQRRAYDAISAAFGPGLNGPLVVVADLSGADDPATATATLQQDLAGVDGVLAALPTGASEDGSLALFTVVPTTGPVDEATTELVHALRGMASGWQQDTGATVRVTGTTAVQIDITDQLQDAMLPYLLVVVGLAVVLLGLVFRSVLVPVKAALGFLLSVAATFGAVVEVFQKGHLAELFGVTATGPILSFLPIFLIGILFGLAMDYEVFLVTRMREEHAHGLAPREAVVAGFRHASTVVVAAALIMTAVFAGFVTGGETIIKSMGFALAFGVVVDAFLVRMTLVPAVMALLGRAAWWLPRWLDRLLPDVDVEGARLEAGPGPSPAGAAPVAGADAGAGAGRD